MTARPAAATSAAAAAAALVTGRSVVALAGGPMAVDVARRLAGVPELTVLTPCPAVVQALADGPAQVVLLPGQRQASGAVAGPLALAALRELNVEVLVLAAPVRDGSVLCADAAEAALHRALAAAAAEVVLLAEPAHGQRLPSCLRLAEVHLVLHQPTLAAPSHPSPAVALAT